MSKPTPSGRSIKKINDLAICHESTSTLPGRSRGSTSGRYTMVTNINTTIRPTPSASGPRAVCTSLGRNGAPAAAPTRINPVLSPGWLSEINSSAAP